MARKFKPIDERKLMRAVARAQNKTKKTDIAQVTETVNDVLALLQEYEASQILQLIERQ